MAGLLRLDFFVGAASINSRFCSSASILLIFASLIRLIYRYLNDLQSNPVIDFRIQPQYAVSSSVRKKKPPPRQHLQIATRTLPATWSYTAARTKPGNPSTSFPAVVDRWHDLLGHRPEF
jgi:hypothetical protein